jgi:hypothetical protein
VRSSLRGNLSIGMLLPSWLCKARISQCRPVHVRGLTGIAVCPRAGAVQRETLVLHSLKSCTSCWLRCRAWSATEHSTQPVSKQLYGTGTAAAVLECAGSIMACAGTQRCCAHTGKGCCTQARAVFVGVAVGVQVLIRRC